MDPPFAWNCQVVAGAGVVEDVQQLYHDMHAYLAGLHLILLPLNSRPTLKTMSSPQIIQPFKLRGALKTMSALQIVYSVGLKALCRLCRTVQGTG